MQFSPTSCRNIPFERKCAPQQVITNSLSLCSSLNIICNVSQSCKTTDKITLFFLIPFYLQAVQIHLANVVKLLQT
jgi:hypothetical protein